MKHSKVRTYLSAHVFRTIVLGPFKQYELAEKIGVSPSAFNKAIHGAPIKRHDARWRKLARTVGVPLDKLYG